MRARIALPGVAPENVTVEVAGRMLRVQAVQQDGKGGELRYEQSWALPESVDAAKIRGTFRHGLLDLTLPYAEARKPRRIEIETEDRKALPKAA